MQIEIKRNYIIFAAITFVVSFINKILTGGALQWYCTLQLPNYTPPSWLISSAWSLIYILTTAAAIMVWNNFTRDRLFYVIMTLFGSNALLTILWTYLFFSRHSISLAFFDSLALFATLVALIIIIANRSITIASLLVPYIAWLAFAIWLNLALWFSN